jgi:hypothetical protein
LIGWVPFVFATGAVGLLLVAAALQPKPVLAEVLSVRATSSSTQLATVLWADAEGTTRTDLVELPVGYQPADRIPIWPDDGVSPTRFGNLVIVLTPGLLLATGALAFLLGLVVDLSLRGYGYVRNARMDPKELEEASGFYWRT